MNRKARKVNIGEVARKAGVSAMTVSRMINPGGVVAPATRARIQKVINELHYRPSPFARGLASRKSNILGLMIFDNLDFGFFQPMFLGVEQEARANGYDLLVFSRPLRGTESRSLALVDGVLCFGYDFDNETIESLEDSGIPYAIIGKRGWRRVKPWYCTVDYFNGFRNTTKYLLELGHRKIAFLGGSWSFSVDAEKFNGYMQALREAGIPETDSLILCDSEIEKLKAALEKYKPTAVFLESNVFPMQFFLCIREMGKNIPTDISVISTRQDILDPHTLYGLAGIHELTILNIPRRELGTAGVKLLINLIDSKKNIPREQIIDMKLIAGESCSPLTKISGAGKKRRKPNYER
ncbi:MAG: LacI family transcriptional regulator [Treponema sp.]|nr:LacI family transcriptional regulator [Treponema sp.]